MTWKLYKLSILSRLIVVVIARFCTFIRQSVKQLHRVRCAACSRNKCGSTAPACSNINPRPAVIMWSSTVHYPTVNNEVDVPVLTRRVAL